MLLRDVLKGHRGLYNLTSDGFVDESISVNENPTQGNVGRLKQTTFQGIPISIENDIGSIREGIDPDNHHWSTKFKVPYGYINNTWGLDNEEVDVFVGPVKNASMAYIIRQRLQGKPDEDKCVLGCSSLAEAMKLYLDHVDKPEMLGNVIEMSMDEFKKIVCNLTTDGLDLWEVFFKDTRNGERFSVEVLARNKQDAIKYALEERKSSPLSGQVDKLVDAKIKVKMTK